MHCRGGKEGNQCLGGTQISASYPGSKPKKGSQKGSLLRLSWETKKLNPENFQSGTWDLGEFAIDLSLEGGNCKKT